MAAAAAGSAVAAYLLWDLLAHLHIRDWALGYSAVGRLYSTFATISIASLTTLYLRLYFLPKAQSTPPRNPPEYIRSKAVIYECLSPAETETVAAAESAHRTDSSFHDPAGSTQSNGQSTDELRAHSLGALNRCNKDRCGGRWKPARARHCSLCQTCRAGFDHHCAIFANCLTVPYIPTFLCLLTLTPPTIALLASPVIGPLIRRGKTAWAIACADPSIMKWWDWPMSWVVAGGPVGRWAGGLVLGWRVLDRADGGGHVRVANAGLVFLGAAISAICLGLALTTITLIKAGQLTVDRERMKSHDRTVRAMLVLQKRGQVIPQRLRTELERYADRRWFFVPDLEHDGGGWIVPTLPSERAYDLGAKVNWELVMGPGWGWLLPWQALRRGMALDRIANWPIHPTVEERLRAQARVVDQGTRSDTAR